MASRFGFIGYAGLDTTGTLWAERQQFLASVGLEVEEAPTNSYGMNWKMSAKTILVQLHHKVRTFEHVNRHFVLALQDHFLDSMQKSFPFDHIGAAKLGDTMHFYAYSLLPEADKYRIELATRFSTNSDGIGMSLGLQGSPDIELQTILNHLEQKIARATKNTQLLF